jgi:hypothetical protein
MVYPQLVSKNLVRSEKTDGTRSEKENSLLVPVVRME